MPAIGRLYGDWGSMARKGVAKITNDRTTVGDDRRLSSNDVVFITQRTLKLTAETLGNVQLTLPFLYAALSGPLLLAGMLVPFYRIALDLSGVLIAPLVSSARIKGRFLALGAVSICIGLVIVAVAAGGLDPWLVAPLFISCAVALGIGDGVSSIAAAGIMGEIWEVQRRGSLMGTIRALTGFVAIGIALLTLVYAQSESAVAEHMQLVWAGAAAAALAAMLALLVQGGMSTNKPALIAAKEPFWHRIRSSYGALIKLGWFRRLLAVRLMYTSVEYGSVFYAIHAADRHASDHGALAAFAIAAAAGATLGGLVSRYVLRVSERLGLMVGGGCGCLAAIVALAREFMPSLSIIVVYSAVFLLLNVAYICVYTGRNAYFLAFASARDRENGVALNRLVMEPTNILFVMVMSALAHFQHVAAPVVVIGMLSFGGILVTLTLPSARNRP